MVAFNKSENEAITGTGLSNASRGVPADESLGTLFANVGKGIENTLSAYDESTKVKIQIDADRAVNGENGAVAAATPDAQGNFPPGSEAYLSNIANLKVALDQGVISKNIYDTKVAVEAKRLRSSVPDGYGMFVDQALSSAVGSSTATQALQTRLATVDSLTRQASAEVDGIKKWIEKSDVNEYLSDPVFQESFRRRSGGMSVEQFMDNPDPAKFNDFQLALSDRKVVNSNFELWKKKKEMGEYQTSEDTRLAVDKLFQDSLFSKVDGKMFDYTQKVAQFNSDGTIDANEAKILGRTLADVKTEAQVRLSQTFMETRASSEDRTKMQAELDNIMQPFEQALVNPNYGLLFDLTNSMNREQDLAAQKLYGSAPKVRAAAAMKRNNLPDQMIASLWSDGDNGDVRAQSLAAVTSTAVATGDKSASEVIDLLGETRENANGDVKALMKNLTTILNSPVNTPEGVASAAVNIFSAKNQDMLNRIAPENRIAAFEQFLSPVVIEQLSKSGNQDALKFAENWGTKQFDAISKYAKDTVMDAQKNRLMADITFEDNKFVWHPRNPGTGERMTMMSSMEWERAGAKEAYRAVSDLNRYIATMEPLWAKHGMEPAAALSMMEWEDVNKVGKAPTLLHTLGEAVWNTLSGPEEGAGKTGKQSSSGSVLVSPAAASIPKEGEKPASAAVLDAQVSPNPDASELEDLPSAGVMKTAAKQLGMNERDQKDAIKEYLQNGGINLDPSTTAWCAAYVNATLAHNGLKGTGSNLARSFLQYGEEVSKPREGDIVVFSRGAPGSGKGHVGFFKGFDKKGNIIVLGGNQGDSVSEKSYDKSKLLGYRRIPGHNRDTSPKGLQVAAN